jgi:pyridinium-3,5-bisthiocarboxylic acid mononucleotide nickel chelatase
MIAYLDCFSGISGDMLLGALLDAGLALDALRAGLATLPLHGYTFDAERITDHGITGTRALVRVDDSVEHAHRRLADVQALIAAASLPPRAGERARAIFARLAAAEAVIHGTTPDEVTFHEVGAVDSIVDIVGAALGLELLAIDEVYCSELPLTSGRVKAAHGDLPVPAPATLELLKGTAATWRAVPTDGELVTPTGAAIVATLAHFERPTIQVSAIGYGFGSKRLPWANCLRLVLGDASPQWWGPPLGAWTPPASAPDAADLDRDTIVVLETNIDNMTGEALGWLMDRLLAASALDVSYTPLHMKKNRPGTLLTVLAGPDDAERLASIILRESATLGVRMQRAERRKAGRREETIETPLGPARIKLKLLGDRVVAASPEYEDCRVLAARAGLPLETVVQRLAAAARAHFGLNE